MKIQYLSFAFLLLTGCNKAHHSYATVNIDITNNTKKTYQEVARTTKFIRLITDTNIIITEVNKIYIANHRINILDQQMAAVYTFDESGKFLYKISSPGVGVGKYLHINDIDANSEGTQITILDAQSNKLLTFAEGKFIKETKLPFRTDALAIINDNIVFHRDLAPYMPDLMYQIIVTDKRFNVKDKFMKIEKTTDLSFSPQNPLQRKGNDISFLPVYSPIVFNIGATGFTEKYFLDFGKNWMTDEFIYSKRVSKTFISDISQSNFVYFVNTVDGDGYLTISFVHQHRLYTAVYSKSTKKLVFISDFNSSYCGDFGFQAYQENQFVSIIRPQQFLDNYKNGKIKDKGASKLIGAIKASDNNPILMLTTFEF